MAVANAVHEQRYSSFENRADFVDLPPIQTVLPSAPPRSISNHRPSRYIFTIGDDSYQDGEQEQRPLDIFKHVKTCGLVITCIFILFITVGLTFFTCWIIYQVVIVWTHTENGVTTTKKWKHRDETTLCVTIPGKDMHFSGCSQYLLQDIDVQTNYTCCVKDSTSFIFVYDMILNEDIRSRSGVKNTICTHSHARKQLSNDHIVWYPTQHCEVNGMNRINTTDITIPQSRIFTIYFSITIYFSKTYKNLANDKIRIKLYRQKPENNTDPEVMIHKMMNIRKEWQNYEQFFFFGTFMLNKNDSLYVEVRNEQYIYTYERYCSLGFYKIH